MEEKRTDIYLTWWLLIVPIIVLVIVVTGIFSAQNRIDALKSGGTTVTAAVTDVKKSNFTQPGTDSVTVSYTVDGKDYSTIVLTKTGKLQTGDEMTLLCNPEDPSTASTEEHYDYWMKTRRVILIILGVFFVITLILWFVLVILPRLIDRRERKAAEEYRRKLGFQVYRNQQGEREVRTPYGTITRNPNRRK